MSPCKVYSHDCVLCADRVLKEALPVTHHPTLVSIQELHHLLRLLLPQVHVAAVAAAHNVLTARAVEVHAFH